MTATILAALAIVVSVATALLSWKQFDRVSKRSDSIQERLAAVEEARRVDEREPRFHIEWCFVDGEPIVRLTNSGERLDNVRWSFDIDLAQHPLIGLGTPPATTGEFGPLDTGKRHILDAELSPVGLQQGEAVLRLDCQSDADTWCVVYRVPVDCHPR